VWVTRELSPGTKAVIDTEHVLYVDPPGETALHWLNRLRSCVRCTDCIWRSIV